MVFSAPDEDAPKRRKDRDSIYSKFYGETLYPEDGHEGSGIKKIPRLGQGWNTVEAMVPLDVKGIRGALKVAERSDRETGKRYIAAVGIDPLWNDAEFNMNTIDKMQIWEIEDLPGELYVPLQLMYWSLGPELHYFRDMYPDSSTSDGPTIASSVSAQRPNLQTYPLDASSSKFISSSCRRQLKESGVEYKTALKHHIGESIAAPQTDMQITDTGPDRHATRKNGTVAPPNANYPAVYDSPDVHSVPEKAHRASDSKSVVMINARGELEVYSPDIFLSDRAAVKLANEICFSGRLALQLKLTGPRLSKSQRNRLS